MKKLLVFAIAILGFSAVSFGQSASATASGTIVTAISIAANGGSTALNFGNIVGGAAGTVVLPGVASPTRQSSLTLPAGGTVSSAGFVVSGTSGLAYTVTLPESVTVTKVSSTETMTVDAFSCDVALAGTSATGITAISTLAGSSRTFYVGATLNVTALSPSGTYTSSPFNVTVAYN